MHTYVHLCTLLTGGQRDCSSAQNMKTNDRVAIKKIRNAFENRIDSKRTIREVQLLRQLQHENIIALRELIPPQDPETFQDVYVVYDLMDTDLHQIIRSQQSLSDDHCQYFIYQVRTLKEVATLACLTTVSTSSTR